MSLQPSWVSRQYRYLPKRREKKFDYYLQLVYVCMYVIDSSRSGVLRISSEEIDKKLMYLPWIPSGSSFTKQWTRLLHVPTY